MIALRYWKAVFENWQNDVHAGVMFYRTMRRVRREFPTQTIFQRLGKACELMQQAKVDAQIDWAIKYGGTR